MKHCIACDTLKNEFEFTLVHSKGRTPYYKKYCKCCSNKKMIEYRKDNPEKFKKYEDCPKRKKYLSNFKLSYNKKYYKENKDTIIKQHVEYERKKYKTDLNFRILRNLRTRFRLTTNRKKISKEVKECLGCTFEEFRLYLEKQFKEGMSWNNYGSKIGCWSIDHIIPCSSFDLSKFEEIKKCFHFSNCQPMWTVDNSSKGNRII
jgi:hypothetical protein